MKANILSSLANLAILNTACINSIKNLGVLSFRNYISTNMLFKALKRKNLKQTRSKCVVDRQSTYIQT